MTAWKLARIVLVAALSVLLFLVAITAGLPLLYLLLAWAGVVGG